MKALKLLLGFLWENIGTFLLAFSLALAVWISAVIADDPNVEQVFPGGVPLTITGLPADIEIIGSVPNEVAVRLRAPQSVWDQMLLESDIVQATVDLAGLPAGEHALPINLQLDFSPVQVLSVAPTSITLVLERLITADKSIRPVVTGDPALGFHPDYLSITSSRVTIAGTESLVERVKEVRANLDISGARENITAEVYLRPVDEQGQLVAGVTLSPDRVTIKQTIVQSGGYRDLAVKVETIGQVASGHRITDISVSPPTVTVFSSDPQLVAELPGLVRTLPLDLTEANADIDTRLVLDLPEGITVVGAEQSVAVVVGVAPIETSISITVPIEVLGLGPDLHVEISLDTVDVILSGPLNILEQLRPEEVRIFVNLTDLTVGSHLVILEDEILPEGVVVDAITPETIEVVILEGLAEPEPEPELTVTPTP